MSFSLDSQTITLTCPKCKQQLKEKIGRLKRDKHVTCSVCGRIAVDTDQVIQIERSINQELAKLGGKKITLKF